MKSTVRLGFLLLLTALAQPVLAQDAAPPPAPAGPTRSSSDLDQLLGPIALYPDPLIGVILPAAADPQQIVLADRYISQGGDPNQVSDQPWDASVQGLAHYTNVLQWMTENLQWTTEIGQAFASQQNDVMDSIQRLRAKAQALGNLQNTPQETVSSDDGTIDIDPADPNDIYVPYYQPDSIYYQPGIYCTFGFGFPIGAWLGNDWDWRNHHLITWGPGHPRPDGWWQRPMAQRIKEFPTGRGNYWRPVTRSRSVIVAGGDRGFSGAPNRSSYNAAFAAGPRAARAPEAHMPSRPAPQVDHSFSAPTRAPEVVRSVERAEPSEGAFGGSQSAREVRASSDRGAESRGGGGGGFSGARSGGSSNRR